MASRNLLKIAATAIVSAISCGSLAVSQEKSQEQSPAKKEIHIQLSGLPSIAVEVPDEWHQPNSVNLTSMVQQFYLEHPDVILDPLKKSAQFTARKFTIAPDLSSSNVHLSENRAAIFIPQLERPALAAHSGFHQIHIPLLFRPAITLSVESKAQLDREIQTVSREIAQKTIELFPDFSRDYIKKQLKENEAEFDKQFREADQTLSGLRDQVAHYTGLPAEKAAEQLAEISRQQIAVQLSLVGMEAREKAIAGEIDKYKEQVEAKVTRDETLSNLQRLLKLRLDQLERLKQIDTKAKGVVSQEDIQKGEADVLAVKIDLDKTRAALNRSAGGEQLDAFTAELSRLAIDRAETQARRDWLEKLSIETSRNLTERREAEHRLDSLKPKLAKAELDREDYQTRLQQVRYNLENIQPLHLLLPDEPASEDSK